MGNNNILKSCFSIEFLKKINNESQRSLEHLQEVVQKLENRIYTHGLNVKRLKSKPSWAIWQAKLNDSRRLLFTFHRHLEWDSNNQNTYIHFWTIIDKKQDDVNNWLKRKTNSSKWFNSEEIWSEKKEVDNIPDNPAIDLTEVDKHSVKNSWDSYFNLDNRFDIPVVDPPDSLPWFTNNDGNIQNLLEKNDYYYNELLLTKEQVGFVSNELPMLVNGSAGSGKTTLAIYKMKSIYESYKESNIVYISYNNSLVKHAKSLFKTLIPDFSTERISFYKFNDYYKEYLNKNSFDKHIITWNDVIKLFEQQGMTFNKAWNVTAEIRSVIKGKLTDLNSAYLDKDTYIQLPSKHTFFKNDDRLEVYKHFEYYCGYLKENNFIDDQDLANIILKSGKIETPYDIIVIDEVQDLTEKQITILIDSIKDSRGRGIYITGDENQTIHPTSFSWSKIKDIYHKRNWNPPKINRLTKNFRSTKQITKFANAFLDIAKELKLESTLLMDHEISDIDGTVPEMINNKKNIIEYFKTPNPFNAILTSTKKQKESIKKEVEHPYVWTIQEAKGLGFNLVLLFKPEIEIFDKNIFSDFKSSLQDNFILQQLRSFYVGASRARKDLIILPVNRKNPIWRSRSVIKALEVAEDANNTSSKIVLEKKNVTSKDWESQGKYFFKKEQYNQAVDCFTRSKRMDFVRLVYWVVTEKRDGEDQIVKNISYPIDKWLAENLLENIVFLTIPELIIALCEYQKLDIDLKESHKVLNLSSNQIEKCRSYVEKYKYSYNSRVSQSINIKTSPSKQKLNKKTKPKRKSIKTNKKPDKTIDRLRNDEPKSKPNRKKRREERRKVEKNIKKLRKRMSKDNKFKKENIDPFPSGSATKFLVSINITLFFLNAILSNHVNLVNIFGLSSKMTGLTIWQPITYMFIQNNLSSFILMNVTLWFFGNNLESLLGRKKYLLYYFFIGASSGLVWLLTNSQSDTILIGPLGAVVGLIVAIGMLNPNSTSYWYFMIPIKTISFVKLLFVLNLIFHFRGYDYSDLVLSAMLIGFIYMKLLSRS